MKVYTRTGDKGMTSLIGGERVFKTDERVEAYGTVDELSAFVALLADRLRPDATAASYVAALNNILSRLMTVEALLAQGTLPDDAEPGAGKVPPLDPACIVWLEEQIDALQAALPAIDKFTLPGGHETVSLCHVCRTVCRRAERTALRADHRYGVDASVLGYLNRLSDYFYVLGRSLTAHYGVEEILWIP